MLAGVAPPPPASAAQTGQGAPLQQQQQLLHHEGELSRTLFPAGMVQADQLKEALQPGTTHSGEHEGDATAPIKLTTGPSPLPVKHLTFTPLDSRARQLPETSPGPAGPQGVQAFQAGQPHEGKQSTCQQQPQLQLCQQPQLLGPSIPQGARAGLLAPPQHARAAGARTAAVSVCVDAACAHGKLEQGASGEPLVDGAGSVSGRIRGANAVGQQEAAAVAPAVALLPVGNAEHGTAAGPAAAAVAVVGSLAAASAGESAQPLPPLLDCQQGLPAALPQPPKAEPPGSTCHSHQQPGVHAGSAALYQQVQEQAPQAPCLPAEDPHDDEDDLAMMAGGEPLGGQSQHAHQVRFPEDLCQEQTCSTNVKQCHSCL